MMPKFRKKLDIPRGCNYFNLGHAFGILILLAAVVGFLSEVEQAQERSGWYLKGWPVDRTAQPVPPTQGVYPP